MAKALVGHSTGTRNDPAAVCSESLREEDFTIPSARHTARGRQFVELTRQRLRLARIRSIPPVPTSGVGSGVFDRVPCGGYPAGKPTHGTSGGASRWIA